MVRVGEGRERRGGGDIGVCGKGWRPRWAEGLRWGEGAGGMRDNGLGSGHSCVRLGLLKMMFDPLMLAEIFFYD